MYGFLVGFPKPSIQLKASTFLPGNQTCCLHIWTGWGTPISWLKGHTADVPRAPAVTVTTSCLRRGYCARHGTPRGRAGLSSCLRDRGPRASLQTRHQPSAVTRRSPLADRTGAPSLTRDGQQQRAGTDGTELLALAVYLGGAHRATGHGALGVEEPNLPSPPLQGGPSGSPRLLARDRPPLTRTPPGPPAATTLRLG